MTRPSSAIFKEMPGKEEHKIGLFRRCAIVELKQRLKLNK